MANAEEIIKKAKYDPETKSYLDSKYIKRAGDILWSGCFVALESVFHVRKNKGRPSIEKYREAVAKRDGKLLRFLNNGYEVTHLFMGYDGAKDRKVCNRGFALAKAIIDQCAMLLPEPVCA